VSRISYLVSRISYLNSSLVTRNSSLKNSGLAIARETARDQTPNMDGTTTHQGSAQRPPSSLMITCPSPE
ncbi:MAG: hypothetical protein KJ046_17830, partial [Anaerolineae bacterium]|nr:hypothetical protein [Anaerolineae bacterium]